MQIGKLHSGGRRSWHTYGEWTVTKEATETEDGTKERSCTVCEYKQTEVISIVTGTPTVTEGPTETVTKIPEEKVTPTITECPEEKVTPTITEHPEEKVTPTITEYPKEKVTPTVTENPAVTVKPVATAKPTDVPVITKAATQTPTPTLTAEENKLFATTESEKVIEKLVKNTNTNCNITGNPLY